MGWQRQRAWTRRDAAADTWAANADDPAGSEPTADYDVDVEALLAREEALDGSRTRHEAAADAWDEPSLDTRDTGSFTGRPASDYDGDVEALLAAEERQPEPRTRQDAAADTWSVPRSGQGASPGSSTDVIASSPPDTITEPSTRNGAGKDDTSGPYVREVAVRAQDGTEVPITVEYVPPEARTLGDPPDRFPVQVAVQPQPAGFFPFPGHHHAVGDLRRSYCGLLRPIRNGPASVPRCRGSAAGCCAASRVTTWVPLSVPGVVPAAAGVLACRRPTCSNGSWPSKPGRWQAAAARSCAYAVAAMA